MSNKNKSRYLSLKKISYLSLVISVGFHLLFLVFLFYGRSLFVTTTVVERAQPQPQVLIMRFLVNVIRTYILVFLLFLYDRRVMNKTFSNPRWQYLSIVLGSMLIAVAFVSVAFMIDFVVFQREMPGSIDRMFLDMLIRNTLLALIVILTSLLIKSITDQKDVVIENETLKTENMRARFEALKNQMDPHFVFNSLNTLQSLISIDAGKAEEYLQKLSNVLRYSLQGEMVVRLDKEMMYLQSYCDMMKMRYGENLKFVTDIAPVAKESYILPLTLQGLVENAIKHNVISNKKPLTITISSAGAESITVSNNIQPKMENERSNGIGLTNLTERYRLRWDKEIEIKSDDKTFEVTIPLISD